MKDIVELTRLHLNETPNSDDIELLNEFIGLRTGAIVVGLGKVKQNASKLDQQIGSLRRDLSDLRKSTPEDAPQKLADVETNNLLRKYDAEVYEKIIGNLNVELDKTKEEIEQTRLRIKELGKEQKWLDWVQKYADQVDELDTYSDEQKKEYLDGIIDRIEVRLDQETKDHHLDIIFRLPLVGDGIEYVDKNNKSAGYELVDRDTTTTTTVSHELVKSMGVDARRLGRKKEVAKKKEMNQLTPKPHNNITVE